MSYAVRLAPEAEEDLSALRDPLLQSYVLDQLEHLATAPTALSRPGGFPHPFKQKYQFWSPDHAIHFTVLFEYGQDEQTLVVLNIGRRALRMMAREPGAAGRYVGCYVP